MPTSTPNAFVTPTAVPLLSHSCPINLQATQAGEGMTFPELQPSARVVDIIRSIGIWRMQDHCISDVNGYDLQIPNVPGPSHLLSLTKNAATGHATTNSGHSKQSSKHLSSTTTTTTATTRRSSSFRHKGERSSRNHPTPPTTTTTTKMLPPKEKDTTKPSNSTTRNSNSSRGGNPNFIGPDPNADWTIFNDCPPSMRGRLPYSFEGASNFTILGGNWGVQHGSVNHYTVLSDGRVVESLVETEQRPSVRKKPKRRGTSC